MNDVQLAEKAVDVTSAFVKFICCAFLVIACALIGFALIIGHDIRQKQRERYPDWVKLTGRTDITFEEFKRLDNAGYLKASRK